MKNRLNNYIENSTIIHQTPINKGGKDEIGYKYRKRRYALYYD